MVRRRMAFIASGSCGPTTATESALMMPALLPAISVSVSPRYSVWSIPIGVITATLASATLVESQVPPRPTSITAASTGTSPNAA